MYDLGIFGKFADLAGDTVVETGTDGEEHITLADRMIGRIAAVNTDISHIKRVTCRNGSFSHDRCDHRYTGKLHQFFHLLIGTGNIDTASQQE